jgi:hypothetical protein
MATLAMIGRVTMLGLARCTGTGGNYRTAQWFLHTVIAWLVLFCVFFRQPMLGAMDTHLLDLRSTCKQGKSVGLYPSFRTLLCHLSDVCVPLKVLYTRLTSRGEGHA